MKFYFKVLKKMLKHKQKYPYIYNGENYEYICKKELNISNNVTKGVILYKFNSIYIVDIFVTNGIDSIITNLLSKKLKSKEEALCVYDEKIEYIKSNNIIKILKDGENNFIL